jgi:hypothetical protein
MVNCRVPAILGSIANSANLLITTCPQARIYRQELLIMRAAVRTMTIAVLFAAGLTGLAPAATAQDRAAQRPARELALAPPAEVVDAPDAERTREELMQLLEKYPPSLGRVIKLDPTLLSSDQYLATYPVLHSFLAKHPEVQRNQPFFFERIQGSGSFDRENQSSEAYRMWGDVLGGLAGITVAIIVLASLGWMIRSLIDYRRWARLSRVQAEAHNKLLDRMTANEELLAYVQSPAGARFLESAPIALDPGARSVGAPFSRILWSVQAGLVLASGGFGLQYVSGRAINEAAQPIFAMGILAVALGIGFVLSAGVSYALSHRLGLFAGAAPEKDRSH